MWQSTDHKLVSVDSVPGEWCFVLRLHDDAWNVQVIGVSHSIIEPGFNNSAAQLGLNNFVVSKVLNPFFVVKLTYTYLIRILSIG